MIPDGTQVFDPTDPHYRYRWLATLDDGSEVPQLDAAGRSRSVGVLDFGRVSKLQLIPVWDTQPPAEVRVRLDRDERAIKFWQVDQTYQGGEFAGRIVREVLGLQRTVDGVSVKAFLLIDEDGGATFSSKQDIPYREPEFGPIVIFADPSWQYVLSDAIMTLRHRMLDVAFSCRRNPDGGWIVMGE